VFLVDVLDRVLEPELKCDVGVSLTIAQTTPLTLAAVEVKKS
jgi:hypothetical protein